MRFYLQVASLFLIICSALRLHAGEDSLACSAEQSKSPCTYCEPCSVTMDYAYVVSEDSVATRSPLPADSLATVKTSDSTKVAVSTMTKSPTGAIWRSLVLPGWGQLYNESYWKAALFCGGAVTCMSIIVWNHNKFSNATARYIALDEKDRLKEVTYREKEFYRDQRDVAGLWLVGVYLLAAVDAYTGAHLYDFDVSEKGVTALPYLSPSSAGVSVAIRW